VEQRIIGGKGALAGAGRAAKAPAAAAGAPRVRNVRVDAGSAGQRLDNYLSALAGLTGASAKATRDMDHQLANAVPVHGKQAQL